MEARWFYSTLFNLFIPRPGVGPFAGRLSSLRQSRESLRAPMAGFRRLHATQPMARKKEIDSSTAKTLRRAGIVLASAGSSGLEMRRGITRRRKTKTNVGAKRCHQSLTPTGEPLPKRHGTKLSHQNGDGRQLGHALRARWALAFSCQLHPGNVILL